MRKFEVAKGFEDRGVVLPQRKTAKSAGYDIIALTDEDVYVHPGMSVNLETGVKACMEDDEVMLLFIRSSLGIKQGLTLSNSCGVIDADYYNNPDNDGHFILNIINTGNSVQRIPARSRVAQAVFVKYLTVDDDNATGERIGGIGSTDG
jgi:dUTP pyrophosphatase